MGNDEFSIEFVLIQCVMIYKLLILEYTVYTCSIRILYSLVLNKLNSK